MARKKKITQKRLVIIVIVLIIIGFAMYKYYEPIRNFTFTTGEMLP